MKKVIISILASIVLTAPAFAEEISIPQISVVGSATREITPDRLVWFLSVNNEGDALETVAKQHTEIVKNVIKLLKKLKIDEEGIQTSRMRFGEKYKRKKAFREKDGYYASTNISFKIKDLKKYEEVWMGLSKISEVGVSVNFNHSKMALYQDETRHKALLNAREKAVALAHTIGEEIGGPLLVEDIEVYQRSHLESASYRTTSGGGDVNSVLIPGKIPIQMKVKAVFRILPQGQKP